VGNAFALSFAEADIHFEPQLQLNWLLILTSNDILKLEIVAGIKRRLFLELLGRRPLSFINRFLPLCKKKGLHMTIAVTERLLKLTKFMLY